MASGEGSYEDHHRWAEEHAEAARSLDTAMTRWLELSERIA
jgi:hypothetical protein